LSATFSFVRSGYFEWIIRFVAMEVSVNHKTEQIQKVEVPHESNE
jgi:hypothetical protein